MSAPGPNEAAAQLVAGLTSLLLEKSESPASEALKHLVSQLRQEAVQKTPVGLALRAALELGANLKDPALLKMSLFERLQLSAALKALLTLLED